jgi:nitrogen fixation protein NifU and related proteins
VTVFSETLLEHFQAPRNVGELDAPDAIGEDENPICGDTLRLELGIEDGGIVDVRWRARGCAPTIAAASMASEMLRGMTLADARSVDRDMLAGALGGVPARKAHALTLVVSALGRALDSLGPVKERG